MQQWDDLESWEVLREPLAEELRMRDVQEGAQSPESPEQVDGPAAQLSPEGGSGAKSVLESDPALPQRAMSANAEENLPNGEILDGSLSGHECSPEEAEAEVKGGHRPQEGGSEVVPAANPAGQSLDPGKAHAGRQRKLAMEEMLIRDHLGQEVGCMDAVGQDQSSLEKEEDVEEPMNAEGRGGSWSQPGPVDGGVSDLQEALGEGPPGHELGRRDGPEGESPPAQDQQSPSGILQNESGCSEGPGDGGLEVGSLAKEAGGRGTEPALALAPGDAEVVMETREEEGRGPKGPGSALEPLPASPPHHFPPGPEAKEEAKIPLLDPVQIPLITQDPVPPLHGTRESLPDQIPSQENGGSPPDPEQSPSAPSDPASFLPNSSGFLSDQTLPTAQESLLGGNPPSLQGPLSSSLEMKPSTLQGEIPLLPDVQRSVVDQATSSPLPDADGAKTLPGTQTASSLLEQPVPPLPEGDPLVLQHIPSSGHEMETPTTQQGQDVLGQEGEGALPDTIRLPIDQLSSLPGPVVSLQDTKIPALEESLEDQTPMPPEPHIPPLAEPSASVPSQTPPPVGDPGESPVALLEQLPPVLQGTEEPPSLADKAPPPPPPGETEAPVSSHASPDLPEERGSSPNQAAPPALEDQTTSSLPGQAPSSQEAAKSLPEGQNSSDPLEESANLAEPASPPGKAQSPQSQGRPVCLSALPLCSPETLPPLVERSDAANVAPAGAGELTEALGNSHAEKQPLLKEAEGSGKAAAGEPQSKARVSKPQGATSSPALNDSSARGSANTAHTHLPHQGQGREPEKGKRKSCQCCALM